MKGLFGKSVATIMESVCSLFRTVTDTVKKVVKRMGKNVSSKLSGGVELARKLFKKEMFEMAGGIVKEVGKAIWEQIEWLVCIALGVACVSLAYSYRDILTHMFSLLGDLLCNLFVACKDQVGGLVGWFVESIRAWFAPKNDIRVPVIEAQADFAPLLAVGTAVCGFYGEKVAKVAGIGFGLKEVINIAKNISTLQTGFTAGQSMLSGLAEWLPNCVHSFVYSTFGVSMSSVNPALASLLKRAVAVEHVWSEPRTGDELHQRLRRELAKETLAAYRGLLDMTTFSEIPRGVSPYVRDLLKMLEAR